MLRTHFCSNLQATIGKSPFYHWNWNIKVTMNMADWQDTDKLPNKVQA